MSDGRTLREEIEIFVAWGHARFGFFVKNFLTEIKK
jgi:hypothetical protein